MKNVFTGQMDARMHKAVLSQTLTAILNADDSAVYLDADLMSCIGMTGYAKEHPERAVQCGIAEGNMIGVACGLASAGFRPIAHSFGTFASRRCFDQVFLSGGYAGNDITVIGSDPGVCAAYNGGTHMPFEDVALYRAIPGATIVDITDSYMLENVLPKLYRLPGVKYMRMGRKNNFQVYDRDADFQIGKAELLREGTDVTLVAAGIMVGQALLAAWQLEAEGVSAAVLDMFTLKPIDRDALLRQARQTGAIVTAENHNRVNGLYSAVTDVLASACLVPAEYVAVEDCFGDVGAQSDLQRRFGLTADHICQKALRAVERKKNQSTVIV